ncbi:hypothetical protein O971_09705 [Mycobacterium avium subsp. hominissuis 10-4249]|nr:hypothetical protein O971_09705 [Mycobacterium avium subsp. hominissuis 10-4249]KDO97105.1 hypothetical protein MAVA5_09125 [Mycobacterium avium subsp. hominissuis A5]
MPAFEFGGVDQHDMVVFRLDHRLSLGKGFDAGG